MSQVIKMHLISTVFFSVVSFLHAAEDLPNLVIKSEDFPLKEGIMVEYQSKSDLKAVDAELVKHEYTESTTASGKDYIKRIVTLSDGTKQASYFYKSDEGIIRVPAIASSEKTVLIKLPLAVGTKWIHEDFIGSKSIKSDKKAEMLETINTPLGNLDCIRVRQHRSGTSDAEEDTFLWVAKKYGIVKIEMNKKTGEGRILKTVITITKFEENKE